MVECFRLKLITMEELMSIYKRMIVILITGIMLIGLITFFTGRPEIRKSSAGTTDIGQDKENTDPTPVPSQEPDDPIPTEAEVKAPVETIKTGADNPLTDIKDIYPDILELVTAYFNAEADADIDTLKTLVLNPAYIIEKNITDQSENITAYKDISCYSKRGIGDIKFVVYCTANIDIPESEKDIPTFKSFYITYPNDDGKPLIFSGSLDKNIQTEIDKLDIEADVLAIYNIYSEDLKKVLQEDPSLIPYWRKLINAADETVSPSPSPTLSPTPSPTPEQ